MTTNMANKCKNQGGIQTWSRGEIFPATIVIKGFGDNQRIFAKHGDWKGEEFSVKLNCFNKAHRLAEKSAINHINNVK